MSDPNHSEKQYTRLYSIGEEIANSIASGLGVALGIGGLIFLVVLAVMNGDNWLLVSFSIYGSTLIILHLASTLYHAVQNPRIKINFQKFDHAAIYLLIAGTYTPFLLVSLRSTWGWTLLVVIWGIAALGVGFKTLFLDKFVKLSIIGYILMGWLGVIVGARMLASIPRASLLWLAIGGMLFTIGIVFLAWRRIPYNHFIWHLFVLGGSAAHLVAVYHLVPGA